MPLSESIKEFWYELRRQKVGIAGLALLVILIGLVAFFPIIANPEDVDHWYDNVYWEHRMLPKLAPPEWANALDPHPYPTTHDIPKDNVSYIKQVFDISTLQGYIEYMNKTGKMDVLVNKLLENPKMQQLKEALIAKYGEKEGLKIFHQIVNQTITTTVKSLWEKESKLYTKIIFLNLTYTFSLKAGKPPKDIAFQMKLDFGNILYDDLKQGVGVYFKRPDGIIVSFIPGYSYPTRFYDINQYAPLGKEDILNLLKIPYTREKAGNTTRIVLNSTSDWFFFFTEYGSAVSNYQQGLGLINVLEPITKKAGVQIVPGQLVDFLRVLFSRADKNILVGQPNVLNGVYQVQYLFLLRLKPEDANKVNIILEPKRARVMGAYGLLGTDNNSRDLWSAIVYGVRWALLIGLLTAFGAVMVGVIYGMTSGYVGGWTDMFMQRVAQVVYSLPVLPLLILLAYFVSRSIWIIIALLVAFGWVGLQFTVRSMVLQIREQPYIEAAKALGASNLRILFRYVFPQLLPYAFASMALSVPGAILTEAGLSFLGLGDPELVTWGKILNEANRAGAVLANAWWWILPPGLMIAVTALTFVMIGMAIERIVEPRLRTR